MNKINFEPIGIAMEAFDTDKMDIYRRQEIANPDGTTGETGIDVPLYTDIPCHVAFTKADNTNTATSETQPIIVGLRIHCNIDVDVQNGDYIVAKKLSDAGSVLETYKGNAGEPSVSQSRKSILMQMETDV